MKTDKMKTAPRKITVENQQFLYIVSINYGFIGSERLVLRVFLSGCKQTPLCIYFDTFLDTVTGHPFFSGIRLENTSTKTSEVINANFPGLVRKFVLWGQALGWTGAHSTAQIDGIRTLQQWGFDTSAISYWEIDHEKQKGFVAYYTNPAAR